jgi:hypothetical protein
VFDEAWVGCPTGCVSGSATVKWLPQRGQAMLRPAASSGTRSLAEQNVQQVMKRMVPPRR